jgi:AcrR family transcriptional regulator
MSQSSTSASSTASATRGGGAEPEALEPGLSPRSHKARREKARERILAAAYKIVANGGFDDITLAGVGEAAGYSRALPAHYFGSKEELIAALADSLESAHAEYIGHMSKGEGGLATLLSSVKRLLDQPAEEPDAIRAFYAFLGASLAKPMLGVAARRVNDDTVARMVKLIQQGQQRGQIKRELDPHVEARVVFAGVRGAITLWLVEPDTFPLKAVRDAYVDQLKRALSV